MLYVVMTSCVPTSYLINLFVPDPGYGARDPRWIGAWWLGYILCPSFLVISSLVISTFPKHLPPERDASTESEVAAEAYAVDKSKEMQATCHGERNTSVYTVNTSGTTAQSTDNMQLMEREVIRTVEKYLCSYQYYSHISLL